MSKQTEALKLALEALESYTPGDYSTGHVIYPSCDEDAVIKAITALTAALEQPKLSDYEPDGTHHNKPAPVRAYSQDWFKALESEQPAQQGRDWSLLEATQESLREHAAEIKRLRALLAEQPAQQCWKCGDMNAAGQAKCTVPACGMKE